MKFIFLIVAASLLSPAFAHPPERNESKSTDTRFEFNTDYGHIHIHSEGHTEQIHLD